MTQKHKWHREIIAFANGEEVVYRKINEKYWSLVNQNNFTNFNCPDYEFDIVPKTILINGFKIPEPYTKKIDYGIDYYVPCLNNENNWEHFRCYDDDQYHLHLKRGIVHIDVNNAIAHTKALLSFTKNEEKCK